MMVKKLSFLLILISLFVESSAQEWSLVKRNDLQQEITAADIGSLGKVYIGTERGNVYSFQADGSPETQFSSSIFVPVTSLDASNSLRVMVFYSSANQFEFLDRFTAQPRIYNLDDYGLQADHLVQNADATFYLIQGDQLIRYNFQRATSLSSQTISGLATTEIQTMISGNAVNVLSDRGIGTILSSGEFVEDVSGEFKKTFDVNNGMLTAIGGKGILEYNIRTGRAEWTRSPISDASSVLKLGEYYHFVRGSELITFRLEE